MYFEHLLNKDVARRMMLRRERRASQGLPNEALTLFVRCMLPANGVSTGIPSVVSTGLALIDPRFECLYDEFMPGFLVARRLTGGLTPSPADLFVLVVEVQAELHETGRNLIWPTGRPCAPGAWLIPYIRSHYVGDIADKVAALKEICDQYEQTSMKREIDRDNKLDELERETFGDIAKRMSSDDVPGALGTTSAGSVNLGIDSPNVEAAKLVEAAGT